ncbi:MAG: MMPL family transporter, partial [Trebonia sp.]
MSTDQADPARSSVRHGPRQYQLGRGNDRLATWLRRLRWPVVIVWVIAIVALNPLSSSLSKVTNDSASAYLPSTAASTKVAELQEAAQGPATTDSAVVVFARSAGTPAPALTPSDLAVAASARAAVAGLEGHTAGLSAPGPVRPSADGEAATFSVNVTYAGSGGGADRDAVKAIRAAISGPVGSAHDGLLAEVTGSAGVTADTSGGNQQTALLLTALIIVAIILLLVYRSPVLWLLPLFGAIGAIVVAQASAHGLANAGLIVSTLSADILIVLVFGAASDYALLLMHRYRAELHKHQYAEAAMAIALRRTLPTLVASAATVTCAMLCLLTADSASLHGLGPVGAVGIVAALLAQVTFLPTLLLVFGRWAFWPRAPRETTARPTERAAAEHATA